MLEGNAGQCVQSHLHLLAAPPFVNPPRNLSPSSLLSHPPPLCSPHPPNPGPQAGCQAGWHLQGRQVLPQGGCGGAAHCGAVEAAGGGRGGEGGAGGQGGQGRWVVDEGGGCSRHANACHLKFGSSSRSPPIPAHPHTPHHPVPPSLLPPPSLSPWFRGAGQTCQGGGEEEEATRGPRRRRRRKGRGWWKGQEGEGERADPMGG